MSVTLMLYIHRYLVPCLTVSRGVLGFPSRAQRVSTRSYLVQMGLVIGCPLISFTVYFPSTLFFFSVNMSKTNVVQWGVLSGVLKSGKLLGTMKNMPFHMKNGE